MRTPIAKTGNGTIGGGKINNLLSLGKEGRKSWKGRNNVFSERVTGAIGACDDGFGKRAGTRNLSFFG